MINYKKIYYLSIAGLKLQLETDQNLEVDQGFCPFITQHEICDFKACFQQVAELPPIPKEVIYEDRCYRIHLDGQNGYLRTFFDAPRDKTPYALARYDEEQRILQVSYLEKGALCVSEFRNSFFHLGFEEFLIRKNRVCVHAACIDSMFGGILFSGPSGIGKSTQADLWCKYKQAKMINGDRPVLSKDEQGWKAWGSPYAGSSKCYVNQNCPVTAILILKQSKKCSMRLMGRAEAYRAVWSGVTVHSWDKRFVEKACDLIMELVGSIPVYEFSCTPDERAVDYLEKNLRKEWAYE